MVKVNEGMVIEMKKNTTKYKSMNSDKLFYIICYSVVATLTLSVMYPILYVVSASFSSGSAVLGGKVWVWPVDFSLMGYKSLLKYKDVWIGYRNTIFYTTVGTVLSVFITMVCAYPLTRKGLRGKKFINFFFLFTMYFSGGMIPTYIMIRKMGMLDTIWAVIIPSSLSIYNMIVARTFIMSNIPDELLEAAKMDGCSDFKYFFKVVLPLTKTIMAVLAMWYAVARWNSWFDALIYLNNKSLYPLQLFLRSILVQNAFSADMIIDEATGNVMQAKEIMKYCTIVVSTAPLMAVYPFFQKYFVKGVMIGSLKG